MGFGNPGRLERHMVTVPHTITATVTPQTEDAFGNRTPGTPISVSGCVAWPGLSTETTPGGDTVTTDLNLLMPDGTSVTATDRVTVDGVVYEVVGQPAVWLSPLTGFSAGIQVQLRTQKG